MNQMNKNYHNWNLNYIMKKDKFPHMNSNVHPFHLVNPSPWPMITAITVLTVLFTAVLCMHSLNIYFMNSFNILNTLLLSSFMLLPMSMGFWWWDVIWESTFEGHHTNNVVTGLWIGMALFITSEVMFFFGFFWAFFHSSLNPCDAIGGVWPPKNMAPISAWGMPLCNVAILLCSGFAMKITHIHLLLNRKDDGWISFALGLVCAIAFLLLQFYEYVHAPFSLCDGIYGTTFYMITGFHGFHVMIGTIFLMICMISYLKNHFTPERHFGFEAASWYWHFVDIVWIFVWIFIYWWGGY